MHSNLFDFPNEEIAAVFAPAIGRRVTGPDQEWDKAEQKRLARLTKQARANRWRRMIPRAFWREPNYKYETMWSFEKAIDRVLLSSNRTTPVVWGEQQYLANSQGIKRVHLHHLMKLIDILRPNSVLEVGSGMGTNLAILAAQFPEIRFAGIELSHSGVRVAEQLSALEALPAELAAFSPRPVVDTAAHRKVEYHVGSATGLPFAAHSFDLVYSMQALEQMNAFRGKVLSEMARVAKHNVVMFEPFRDWNEGPNNRTRIRAGQYFDAPIAELVQHGLRPAFSTSNMPHKPFYSVGLVVADQIG